MKIRIIGTDDECRQVAETLPAIVRVLSVDGPKRSRKSARQFFCYVDARPHASAVVHSPPPIMGGLMPCCGRERRPEDRVDVDFGRVTCTGPAGGDGNHG